MKTLLLIGKTIGKHAGETIGENIESEIEYMRPLQNIQVLCSNTTLSATQTKL